MVQPFCSGLVSLGSLVAEESQDEGRNYLCSTRVDFPTLNSEAFN